MVSNPYSHKSDVHNSHKNDGQKKEIPLTHIEDLHYEEDNDNGTKEKEKKDPPSSSSCHYLRCDRGHDGGVMLAIPSSSSPLLSPRSDGVVDDGLVCFADVGLSHDAAAAEDTTNKKWCFIQERKQQEYHQSLPSPSYRGHADADDSANSDDQHCHHHEQNNNNNDTVSSYPRHHDNDLVIQTPRNLVKKKEHHGVVEEEEEEETILEDFLRRMREEAEMIPPLSSQSSSQEQQEEQEQEIMVLPRPTTATEREEQLGDCFSYSAEEAQGGERRRGEANRHANRLPQEIMARRANKNKRKRVSRRTTGEPQLVIEDSAAPSPSFVGCRANILNDDFSYFCNKEDRSSSSSSRQLQHIIDRMAFVFPKTTQQQKKRKKHHHGGHGEEQEGGRRISPRSFHHGDHDNHAVPSSSLLTISTEQEHQTQHDERQGEDEKEILAFEEQLCEDEVKNRKKDGPQAPAHQESLIMMMSSSPSLSSLHNPKGLLRFGTGAASITMKNEDEENRIFSVDALPLASQLPIASREEGEGDKGEKTRSSSAAPAIIMPNSFLSSYQPRHRPSSSKQEEEGATISSSVLLASSSPLTLPRSPTHQHVYNSSCCALPQQEATKTQHHDQQGHLLDQELVRRKRDTTTSNHDQHHHAPASNSNHLSSSLAALGAASARDLMLLASNYHAGSGGTATMNPPNGARSMVTTWEDLFRKNNASLIGSSPQKLLHRRRDEELQENLPTMMIKNKGHHDAVSSSALWHGSTTIQQKPQLLQDHLQQDPSFFDSLIWRVPPRQVTTEGSLFLSQVSSVAQHANRQERQDHQKRQKHDHQTEHNEEHNWMTQDCRAHHQFHPDEAAKSPRRQSSSEHDMLDGKQLLHSPFSPSNLNLPFALKMPPRPRLPPFKDEEDDGDGEDHHGNRRRKCQGQPSNEGPYQCHKLSSTTPLLPYHQRLDTLVPLSINEDPNWLTDFLWFVRSEMVEVFRATKHDVKMRMTTTKRITLGQVGVRCRFCAHLPPDQTRRTLRSSCFPSSIKGIYQSVTMMIRDHFSPPQKEAAAPAGDDSSGVAQDEQSSPSCLSPSASPSLSSNNQQDGSSRPAHHSDSNTVMSDRCGCCPAIPPKIRARFLALKSKTTQGASDSKRYWVEAARKMGMVDSPSQGIRMTQSTIDAAVAHEQHRIQNSWIHHQRTTVPLILSGDKLILFPPEMDINAAEGNNVAKDRKNFLVAKRTRILREYLFLLLSQVDRVTLTEEECLGNRRTMKAGWHGFGCRYCCALARTGGTCRFFPLRRRSLGPKVLTDLPNHLDKCLAFPSEIKEQLNRLRTSAQEMYQSESFLAHIDRDENDTTHVLLNLVWKRIHMQSSKR